MGSNATCDTMIFNGCVFDGTWPNDNMVQVYLPVLWQCSYCTFRPAEWRSPVNVPQYPPGNPGTYATSHTAPGTPYADSWQYIATLNTGGAPGQNGDYYTEFSYCDVWGNAGIESIGGGAPGTPTYFSACYIHDQADNDLSGGSGYHQDGIGPESVGPETSINVTNCTIASLGNTNAIAYQGSNGTQNCIITGCYLSGWGETVSLSTAGPTKDYSITLAGNVFSAEVPYVDGPVYQNWSWNSGGTPPSANTQMLWRNNHWQYFAGDPTSTWTYSGGPASEPIGWDATWNSQYWWPSDDNPHAADYAG